MTHARVHSDRQWESSLQSLAILFLNYILSFNWFFQSSYIMPFHYACRPKLRNNGRIWYNPLNKSVPVIKAQMHKNRPKIKRKPFEIQTPSHVWSDYVGCSPVRNVQALATIACWEHTRMQNSSLCHCLSPFLSSFRGLTFVRSSLHQLQRHQLVSLLVITMLLLSSIN